MIGWGDICKVVEAMAPLYVALVLGYASVRWLHMFKPEHCDAINRFNCYFIMPFFSFDFISHVNPYTMNYKFLTGDVIGKCIICIVLVFWANCSPKGNFSSSITAFSLSSLNNTLVVGVPLLKAMYGDLGVDLVVQSSVIQCLLWFIVLLFLLEVRKVRSTFNVGHELEEIRREESLEVMRKGSSFWSIMKIVWLKLIMNPNPMSCVVGIIWALLSNRWHFKIPGIIEGCILIMSKAGSGVAMFSMGLFMALQEKMITCGLKKTALAMVLRFVVSPATMAVGALAMRLRGDVLRIALMQAALPQSTTSFVYAQEYGLHADILSTAVIFETLASLPLLIAYFAILDVVN